MKTSVSNVFKGKVKAVHPGAFKDEIELATEGDLSIISSIAKTSRERLGLKEGVEAFALIKASSVLLMREADNYVFSTRNQFNGKVSKIKKGPISDEVRVDLPDGTAITSMITEASVENLGLAVGSPVTVIFKAMNVILAVPAK